MKVLPAVTPPADLRPGRLNRNKMAIGRGAKLGRNWGGLEPGGVAKKAPIPYWKGLEEGSAVSNPRPVSVVSGLSLVVMLSGCSATVPGDFRYS